MTLEYISGFFDADGSISMSYNNKKDKFKTIRVDFTNTDLKLLLNIQSYLLNNYKIKLYLTKKTIKKVNHSQSYCLSTSSNQSSLALCKLLNSFHTKKKHRINTVLKYHNQVTIRNGKYSKRQIARKLAYERLFFSSIFQ